MTPPKTSVLFVCMGNICRSPLAEGVFLHQASERGVLDRFEVDSCGTGGWHVGERADVHMRKTAARHGVELLSRARQVSPDSDFTDVTTGRGGFDWIIAMDEDNLEMLLQLGAPSDRLRLLRSFDPALEGKYGPAIAVPDPYYGSGDGFERVYEMVWSACEGLLDHLETTRTA